MALLAKNGLVPIHPLTLVPGYCMGTNVYIWNEEKGATVKLLSNEQLVTESTFSFLDTNRHLKLFVENTSFQSYQKYLFDHLETWISEPRVPSILKASVVAECLHAEFSAAFEARSINQIVKSSIACSNRLVDYGGQINLCGRELKSSLRHDSSFVTHAINTAFYSFLIAQDFHSEKSFLLDILSGAMLHDIGKLDRDLFDSDQIDDKGSPKDWTDRRSKTHPTEGFRRLCHVPEVTETHLMICYQHHERIDGQGFPVALLGNEIHEASRICAVANRYDGLTSERCHRPAMTRLAAMRILESEKNHALDSEVVRCLSSKINSPSNN
jgi:HD-GYP domain-containing protein (c-di-GMP phosphodiesterase class II)